MGGMANKMEKENMKNIGREYTIGFDYMAAAKSIAGKTLVMPLVLGSLVLTGCQGNIESELEKAISKQETLSCSKNAKMGKIEIITSSQDGKPLDINNDGMPDRVIQFSYRTKGELSARFTERYFSQTQFGSVNPDGEIEYRTLNEIFQGAKDAYSSELENISSTYMGNGPELKLENVEEVVKGGNE